MTNALVEQVRIALQQQIVDATLGNDRIARDNGLQMTDLQTLHLLVLNEDIRTPRQISSATGIPTSTVTRIVDRLERAGFIRRTPDDVDRRRTVIDLVPEAIAPLQSLYGDRDERFATLASSFSADELHTVIRFLTAMSEFYTPDKPEH
ncbi:MarR family winged helix-turn-helix transcriptional regulator [Corynebacterium glyciniphilum]|uniref:Transcriptional regulator, MarR-family n=1 Tax=Corynebacterium glyciniphilum AJ 3170 TaxID=1404245 RepID=X5E737_9CORY|nr:MarR family transcriptional regulator [Corynebacterium glyciniphilum]AHW62486.1 Transcriptional regulator, MarR-family [Corynebacterium glyciniphilum AJ 3170]